MTQLLAWPGQENRAVRGFGNSFAQELDPYDAELASMSAYLRNTGDDDDLIGPYSDDELLAVARKLRQSFSPDMNYE